MAIFYNFLYLTCVLFLSSCTYTVSTNSNGEKTRSLSFPSESKNETPITAMMTKRSFPQMKTSDMISSKNIFYLPAMFKSQARLSTLNNVVRGQVGDSEAYAIEIVLAVDYNQSETEQNSLHLRVEKASFPYEFSLSDVLTLSTSTAFLSVSPTHVQEVTRTETKSVNNIEEKVCRYFTSLVFNLSEEEMDRIIHADKLQLDLSFLSGTSSIHADLEELNMNIVREFREALEQIPLCKS